MRMKFGKKCRNTTPGENEIISIDQVKSEKQRFFEQINMAALDDTKPLIKLEARCRKSHAMRPHENDKKKSVYYIIFIKPSTNHRLLNEHIMHSYFMCKFIPLSVINCSLFLADSCCA